MGDKTQDIRLIEFGNYIRPTLEENRYRKWVLNGKNNEFYQYIIDRYNGSPTNASIINSYIDLIIGRGLYDKNESKDLEKLMEVFTKKELKKITSDFELFGEASFQIIHKKNRKELPELKHIAKEKVVPHIENDEGEIEGYWFSHDFKKQYQPKNKPVFYPTFGTSKEPIEIAVIRPYKAGKNYFADPDYLAGLPYAEMEEEIANLYINSIKNGLSAGYIINIPDGISWTQKQKDLFEDKITQKLVGSPNASRFILSFNGRDVEVTIVPIPQNENVHKQWTYLTEEARQQICTAHKLVSTSLVGVSTASGFSSTSDEMDEAEAQLLKRVIQPKQRYITDFLEEFGSVYGLELELDFLPLTEQDEKKEEEIKEEKIDEVEEDVELSNQKNLSIIADSLIEKGEEIDLNEWEAIDERNCSEMTLNEHQLNKVFEFATTPKTADKKSNQDTSLFKIRYAYAGNPQPEREFCQKVMASKKVYRAEDLDGNYTYNEQFSPKGKNSYNIFLYKGGVNCKHWWKRVIFIKKENKRISVNQAKKMILELEPSERNEAKWKDNPKEVAQPAQASNKYWKLN